MHDYYLPSVKKSAIISYNFKEDYVQAYNLYSEWAEFAIDESDKYEAQVGAMRSSYRIGEFDNTLKYASKVIENSVASSGDQQQAYYFIGKASLEQGKETQALQAFAKIADGKNNISAEANYLIAKIYFNQDKIEFAEKQINYVTENNTNYPYWIAKSIILYADIYLKKNDLFNARAALEAIIENFKDDQNIISEANEKLKVVEQKERKASRIKTIDSNSLELDTISGNE
jgi:tetratricopeptide (TPR) repeat protein